eukprot:m.22449 g.22449  ORF g.22449 m.22449 type:complete len:92 (-) comp8843_c0_seq1:140-415(-)
MHFNNNNSYCTSYAQDWPTYSLSSSSARRTLLDWFSSGWKTLRRGVCGSATTGTLELVTALKYLRTGRGVVLCFLSLSAKSFNFGLKYTGS